MYPPSRVGWISCIHSRDYFHQGIFAREDFRYCLSLPPTHLLSQLRLHRHEYLPHLHHLNLFHQSLWFLHQRWVEYFSDFFFPCSAICFSQRMVPNSSIRINQNARNSLNVCLHPRRCEVGRNQQCNNRHRVLCKRNKHHHHHYHHNNATIGWRGLVNLPKKHLVKWSVNRGKTFSLLIQFSEFSCKVVLNNWWYQKMYM